MFDKPTKIMKIHILCVFLLDRYYVIMGLYPCIYMCTRMYIISKGLVICVKKR